MGLSLMSDDSPRASAVTTAGIGFLVAVGLALVARAALHLSAGYPVTVAAVFAGIMLAVIAFVGAHHPFSTFGPANQATTTRVMLLALVAGLIGQPAASIASATSPSWHDVLMYASALSVIVVLLDGLDGWLARRTRMASAFGARFDMETDALFILVLSVLAWRSGRVGSWVLVSGLLRYLFIGAGWLLPWMAAPLPPTRRGRVICIVQMATLTLCLVPAIAAPASAWLAAGGLLALVYSFAVDTRSLLRRSTQGPTTTPAGQLIAVAAALLLLNVSLTFHNVWPTPAIHWEGELSVELAIAVLLLAGVAQGWGRPSRAVLGTMSAIWTLLVVGRYANVTASALYGREVNLYWDLRHMSGVAAMFATAATRWLVLGVVFGVAVVMATVYALARWALGRVGEGVSRTRSRRTLAAMAMVMVVGFAAERHFRSPTAEQDYSSDTPWFAPPVSESYGHQVWLVLHARAARNNAGLLAPSPAMDSSLDRLRGAVGGTDESADVLLLFVEAYGAITYDRPAFRSGLASSRATLEAAIHDTHRRVVSAFVESPTFGGQSWLAHINLLSGVEVKDADTNALLMTQPRDTLVRAFGRHRYRTVGVMPGMWQAWPEGSFYGFDAIYGGEALAYRGPSFGWWDIPDQYSLAKLDALELDRLPRGPVFAVFPMISSHIPFSPRPPYQPDWARMLTAQPYEPSDVKRAFLESPDWLDLGPSYVKALSYTNETLAGYLRKNADRDFVMVVVGDHQAAAIVTGEGASWDVPVHIIASRPAVLDRFLSHGFREGLTPERPVLGKMYELLPVLLDAFGGR